MQAIRLFKSDRNLQGGIQLAGSKSISNRALIVLALANADPAHYLSRLANARDTVTLQRLLAQSETTYDAGDAGTTFRFLTAYLATRPGMQILTGSARMQERPVGALVEALQSLGADIRFLEKEGYPPLQIGEPKNLGVASREVCIQADTSSQFLSALLLIAPYMPQGLVLIPEGPLVSRPYLEMTVQLMRYFGAQVDWQGDHIQVSPGHYTPKPLVIEADWSAASYWYALAAFADKLDFRLGGLFADSWQGDAVLAKMMLEFGVQTNFEADGLHLTRSDQAPRPIFEWDFLDCPDLAQTLAVVCAGLGRQGLFTGLDTLAIKETD
ncbi:MAG: 3-phosphoshikimate 1-carboxyvinyltransferase, partial [Saprospiraceae bacterium]